MAIFHSPKESVKALIAVQELDLELDKLAAGLAAVPARKAAEEAAFEAQKGALAAAKAELIRLQVEKKSKELLAAEKEEEIRKHQRDLNQIKSNEAYKALENEIAFASREKDEAETAVLELMERIDRAAAAEKAEQAAVNALASSLKGRLAAIDAEAADMGSRADGLRARREALLGGMSADLLERYGFLRDRLRGLVVTEVSGQPGEKLSCGGCHMRLRPQEEVDLLKPEGFAICGECRRLMYLRTTIFGAAKTQ
ncbi:MAG: Zn-ribbon protein [Elusimicrobia bacterium]|nr:MAG: Zn-ribbon protein [Elusimicrobiota bacterium]KAF0157660.1 MAG: Zn-ribbon protein [Elusimicrobiota bacterium]